METGKLTTISTVRWTPPPVISRTHTVVLRSAMGAYLRFALRVWHIDLFRLLLELATLWRLLVRLLSGARGVGALCERLL